eukprot:scaffold73358_cov56-Phaeocystis_antarctica.AAC.1
MQSRRSSVTAARRPQPRPARWPGDSSAHTLPLRVMVRVRVRGQGTPSPNPNPNKVAPLLAST